MVTSEGLPQAMAETPDATAWREIAVHGAGARGMASNGPVRHRGPTSLIGTPLG